MSISVTAASVAKLTGREKRGIKREEEEGEGGEKEDPLLREWPVEGPIRSRPTIFSFSFLIIKCEKSVKIGDKLTRNGEE